MHWDERMLAQLEKWLQIKLHHADRTPAMVHGETPIKSISMHLPPYPAGSNPVSTGPTHRHSPLPPINSSTVSRTRATNLQVSPSISLGAGKFRAVTPELSGGGRRSSISHLSIGDRQAATPQKVGALSPINFKG